MLFLPPLIVVTHIKIAPPIRFIRRYDISNIQMSAVSAYIDRIGKQELYRDLDVDRDRGNFIKSRVLKFTYQTLFSAAEYIVAFLLLFVTLTQQLASVNVFQFIQKSQHLYLIGSIIGSCFLIHLIRQFHTRVAQTAQEKKWSSLVIDILKVITCFLAYYFINQQYVVPSHTSNIKYSGCILHILFIVFAARKTFFWVIFTLGSESHNLEPWNEHAVETEAEEEISTIQKKIKGLVAAIGEMKRKVGKAEEKPKDS